MSVFYLVYIIFWLCLKIIRKTYLYLPNGSSNVSLLCSSTLVHGVQQEWDTSRQDYQADVHLPPQMYPSAQSYLSNSEKNHVQYYITEKYMKIQLSLQKMVKLLLEERKCSPHVKLWWKPYLNLKPNEPLSFHIKLRKYWPFWLVQKNNISYLYLPETGHRSS